MSEVKVNKISPRTNCGTVQLGDSGDTFTIPAGASITNSGTASGFGATGSASWVTGSIKTATFTATAGEGYFCNTTGGVFTVNLPSSPTAGAVVAVADYANTFDTNNLTIGRGGSNIEGSASDFVVNTEGAAITLVYVDATKGWIVTDSGNSSDGFGNNFIIATGGTISTSPCGNDKIHTFTGPGTFAVSQIASNASNNVVSYAIVGGGAGGGVKRGGGGGAGGYREVKSPVTPYSTTVDGYPSAPNRVTVTTTSFPVVVGGGGTAGVSASPICNPASTANTNGVASSFGGITAAGGGAGGGTGTPTGGGAAGASGGGGVHTMTGRECAPAANAGGAGNTPPVSPAQGFAGGNACQPEPAGQGGGGGGALNAGVNGGDGQGTPAGDGGGGATSEINGSPVTRAGGGGSGARPNGRQGQGGSGGGGPGANNAPKPNGDPASNGTNGTVNTGGGGGATADVHPSTSGAGGSGVVIIRYKFQ